VKQQAVCVKVVPRKNVLLLALKTAGDGNEGACFEAGQMPSVCQRSGKWAGTSATNTPLTARLRIKTIFDLLDRQKWSR
tara:strand:- start:172 stop:408 length:237 start_codon:yes stop_codon:yes gene_type:complete